MVESIKVLRKICYKGVRDTWYVRFTMRSVSIYLTKFLLKLHVSANQVTFFAISLIIIGGIFFAIGGYVYAIVAALLFNVWLLFDCVDGEIARYPGSA